MIRTRCKRPARGFSLLELIVVMAITVVVAAVAIPQVITATQNFKLRSAASGLSGVMQKGRMLAVARNTFCPVLSLTSSNRTSVFVDINSTGTSDLTDENANTLPLPLGTVFDNTSGSNPSDTTLKGSLTAVPGLPRFNPRGLPCFLSSGVCLVDASKMYIAYLRQDRSVGATGWAAVTVTPAGRVQVRSWDGTKWE